MRLLAAMLRTLTNDLDEDADDPKPCPKGYAWYELRNDQ